jgi:hypothetical protein
MPSAVARNLVFVSSSALDGWVLAGSAEFLGRELRLRAGDRFVLEEAAHVVAEVSGLGDAHDLVGRVHPIRRLSLLGAEVLDRSMVIGDLAYDVVSGFLAAPLGGPARGSAEVLETLGSLASGPPQSDEELLARYLMQRLE